MSKPHTQTCPIASFLNVFGDAWTWLVLRESFYGATRFSEIQRNTGIAKNLLSERLRKLVSEGILAKENVGSRGSRYAYQLTEKGRSLVPVLIAMVQWSNEHLYGLGHEPMRLIERASGEQLAKLQPTDREGNVLGWQDILAQAGPGATDTSRLSAVATEPRSEPRRPK